MRLGKEFALNLSCAQRHIAHDRSRICVIDDGCAGNAADVIVPSVASEPSIERVPPTIELAAIVVLREWTRWPYFRHVGGLRASSLSPATLRAGFAAQASNRSQSFAGIVMIRRSNTSVSAASSALR